MGYLKHNSNGNGGKRTTKKAKETPAPTDHRADYIESNDRHSRCIEEALDGLTSVLSTYVTQARNGDNGSGLYSSPNSYPVRVALVECEDITVNLECDALDRIANAFERIADAMTAKSAIS